MTGPPKQIRELARRFSVRFVLVAVFFLRFFSSISKVGPSNRKTQVSAVHAARDLGCSVVLLAPPEHVPLLRQLMRDVAG